MCMLFVVAHDYHLTPVHMPGAVFAAVLRFLESAPASEPQVLLKVCAGCITAKLMSAASGCWVRESYVFLFCSADNCLYACRNFA